ncbi:MAG: hypothetical protein OCD76_07940 [Reichenbachiella sp.]
MLRVIILSLLYLGSANMYVDAEFEKATKKVVKDKAQMKKILKAAAKFEKEQKAFNKKIEKQVGNFQDMYDEDLVSKEGLEEYFENVKFIYSEYYKEGIDDQLAIKALFSDREWNELVKIYQTNHGMILDAREKRNQLLVDEINKVKKSMIASIDDSKRQEIVVASLDTAIVVFHDFYKASNKINFIDNPILSSRVSTTTDVKAVYADWDKDRAIFYDRLSVVISDMSKNVHEGEWDGVLEALASEF